jgi:hypothetical protein
MWIPLDAISATEDGEGGSAVYSRRGLRRAFALVILIAAGCQSAPPADSRKPVLPAGVSRTSEAFRGRSGDFQFAVIGDRTGGHRPGVFQRALRFVNELQPEFVIGVGDLIEGYTEDRAELAAEWTEVEERLAQLDMPFFFVPGNHDMGNETMRELWRERHGREYIGMGATGGVWHREGPGNVAWVTVTDEGPKIVNLRLDGMFDRTGPSPQPPGR